jgi:hypothetical protein
VVAEFPRVDAVPIVTLELMRGACGFWGMAQVLQFIRVISTVIFFITDKQLTDATPILTGKLILMAGWV